MSTEYHKIQTVWLRDPATNHKTLLEGQWSKPEFGWLAGNEWVFTEKVDGTNIRIAIDGVTRDVKIDGKTDNAQIPAFLLPRLNEIGERAEAAGLRDIVLYGEGYGAKIQKGGGNYKADGTDFVLFDAYSTGPDPMWLERANIEDIAAKLDIGVVPVVGWGSLHYAIIMAREGFNSMWGPFAAEGLVARPAVELRNRRGERVITKIKAKDFAPKD